MSAPYEYVFPAIRGIQAKREYFVSMFPLRLIPKLFIYDEEELTPELRAQRTLNKNRIPEMAQYIVENRDNYVFSALTASVNADVTFDALSTDAQAKLVGLLHVPMNANFIINDGQHRRAAIEQALHEKPELGDETIAVVLFLDKGLDRCQQMFANTLSWFVCHENVLPIRVGLVSPDISMMVLDVLESWELVSFRVWWAEYRA